MITHKLARQICSTKKFLSINAQVNSSNTGERNLRKYNNADCIFINSSELAHEAGRKGDINYLAKDLKKLQIQKKLDSYERKLRFFIDK